MKEDKTTKVLYRIMVVAGIALSVVVFFFLFLLRVKSGNEPLFSNENIAQAIGLFIFVVIGGVIVAGAKMGKGEVDDK